MDRVPQQFLSDEDEKNFTLTVSRVDLLACQISQSIHRVNRREASGEVCSCASYVLFASSLLNMRGFDLLITSWEVSHNNLGLRTASLNFTMACQVEQVNGVVAELKSLSLSEAPGNLSLASCPFTWLIEHGSDLDKGQIVARALEPSDLDQLEPGFPLERLVKMVTLVYEFSLSEKNDKSLEQLATIQQHLSSTPFDCDLSEAFDHIVDACRAHVLLRLGQDVGAKRVASQLHPVSDSAVPILLAAQARFLSQYGAVPVARAVTCARQALALEPDNPRWMALLAETIRRQRKLDWGREEVSTEEVSLLESAVASTRSIRHLLLLAQAYRESADVTFKRHRTRERFFQSQTFQDLSEMQEKAFKLYKEALSMELESEIVNRLVGYGLLKLPGFKSDYRLAEKCLRKALSTAPNNATTIHCLGLYCYKGLMDYEMAAMLCEKAGKLGNFAASLDMLRMKRLVYGDRYDPSLDFASLLRQYGSNRTTRHEILSQMLAYYMLFPRDLTKATDHLRTLIRENAEESVITSHKCTFLNMFYKINLLECFVNQGSLYIQQDFEHRSEAEEKNVKEIASFLDELKELYPVTFDKPLNKNLIDELHKASEEIRQTYVRKKERRDSKELVRRRDSLNRRRCSLGDNLPTMRRRSEPNAVSNIRRSSYGNVTETNRTRNTNAPRKRVSFCGAHPRISESSETVETSKSSIASNKSDKKAANHWGSRSQSKRPQSSGSAPENWRSKDDKMTKLSPP